MTTRGRPKSFCPDRALENAMQLFWQRGYEAASLQDLQAATGLSKSSLYESFGNKQSLFEAAFTRYFDSRSQQMRERLQRAESPLGFIRGCLLAVLEDAQQQPPRGCMLVNVANEFSTGDPAVQPLIELATGRFRQVFEQAFTITVIDLNEAPVVTLAQSSLRVNQNSGTFSLAAFATFAVNGDTRHAEGAHPFRQRGQEGIGRRCPQCWL